MRFARQALPGEPNKLCDLIAAGIVDEYLRRDPETRIRCAVTGGHGAIFVSGELLSSADFDVAQLVTRLLASYGMYDGIEPFVALEPVPSEAIGAFREPCSEPTMVFGYATRETDTRMPLAMRLANDAAQLLEHRRTSDQDWFWLGPAGSVTVSGGTDLEEITALIDHGTQDLSMVRAVVAEELAHMSLPATISIQVNPLGPRGNSGLDSAIGHSGTPVFPYGQTMPAAHNPASRDPRHVTVAGQCLARHAASLLLRETDARAAMVQLLYSPGGMTPSRIGARDEKGRDLTSACEKLDLHLERATQSWRRPGLMTDMVKWGLAGQMNLPWESQD